jgi:radical SAM modification target selenobiotic family peptide
MQISDTKAILILFLNDNFLTQMPRFITVKMGKGWPEFYGGYMDKNHLKQLLAGLCISSLVSGAALMTGCGKQAATG